MSGKQISYLWGAVRNIAQYVGFYIQLGTFVFSMIAAYTTGIVPFFGDMGINVPFWAFAIVVAIIGGLLVFFEYKCTVPGFFAFWNHNWWTNSNPLQKEIVAIRRRQDAILKQLGIEIKDDEL